MTQKYSERFVTLVNDALTRVDEVAPEELMEKLEENGDFRLLDVREKEEREKARIIDSEFLSKGVIEREIEKEEPDQDKEIVLYCGGGHRSALAADNLQKMGYRDVKLLKGGFSAWNEAGLPIEKEDA